MTIEKCFFCDKIVIPLNLITTNGITEYLKENNIEFTLNYTRGVAKIGNKIICFLCSQSLKDLVYDDTENCDCEDCKRRNEMNNIMIERDGE